MTRDPRIDPRPGDILSKPSVALWGEIRRTRTRRVMDADNPDNALLRVRYTDNGNYKYCLLSAWRRWAKSAHVIATEEA